MVKSRTNQTSVRYSDDIWIHFKTILSSFRIGTPAITWLPNQGTLYTWEGYGTISAVVNHMWAWQFFDCKIFVFIVLTAYFTVSWPLHIWYHSIPVYKEFPDWTFNNWTCSPFEYRTSPFFGSLLFFTCLGKTRKAERYLKNWFYSIS